MAITLRKLAKFSEIEQLEAMEGKIWDPSSAIPHHMTLTMQKFGGLFLGAFDGEEMIGFLYSFPGFTNGEPHLCSHMLGFLPEYRKQGLGVQMKWLQKDEAAAAGYSKITWTYDPLETVNGVLNIAKLGGIVRTYLPNCYGQLDDDFNRGLPTDRFLVEWFIGSNRVESRQAGKNSTPSFEQAPDLLRLELKDGIPHPIEIDLSREEPMVLLPVPAFFQDVKRTDMGVASLWREMTCELFAAYFAKGYVVTNILRDQTTVRYVLEKQPLTDILGASSSLS
ncbi:GNAT family N-acetyltransferase [Brevibacillus sp. NPDC058079]|uniref:GNAT family N-acetyltransferase n=1 Tax=Brevibacillus sp. NPDC058079 TaxID=3346330 RepID=UPI0036EE1C1C